MTRWCVAAHLVPCAVEAEEEPPPDRDAIFGERGNLPFSRPLDVD